MSESRVISGDASSAPPPATISTRPALPRIFAAARTLSLSILGGGGAAGVAIDGTRARLPQTSIGHSIAAGPGRLWLMDWIALATFADASAGSRIKDA